MSDKRQRGLSAEMAALWASALPAETAALWASHVRSRRGPKPILSLDVILDAAIGLADAEGLDAVSMGRVAKELGHTPMALYRYVASKNVLLALMLDAIVGEPPELHPGEPWRPALARWSWDLHQTFQKHLWTVDLSLSGLMFGPNRLAWLDRGLQMLAGVALTEQEKVSSLLLLSSYIVSEVQLARDWRAQEAQAEAAGLAAPDLGASLAALVDPARYPALATALAAGAFADERPRADTKLTPTPPTDDLEAEAEFGLGRILDGLEVHMHRRLTTPDTPTS